MAKRDDIIVGLDVGTTKVAAIVGEVRGDHDIDIIGIGTSPSPGLKKGVVINIQATVEAIRKAIHEAELMAACTINNVYVGISGGHIMSFNNKGVVAVSGGQVQPRDVQRVIDNAKAASIPADRDILHIIPQEYVVDGNDGIKQPTGITGVRLQCNVHIVTALRACVQNVVQCANSAGLVVQDVILQQLASAEAVLDEDEKELGVVLVDIGGGTTDVAVFHNGAIVHSSVLPIGGDHITNDIAVGLRTAKAEAEKVKVRDGCAMSSLVDPEEMIEVACVGGREPNIRKRTMLCEIIEPRIEEIFKLVENEVHASGYREVLGSGVVATGGTALMKGIDALGEELLQLPVRVGHPRPVGGLYDVVNSPKFASGLGLVLYGARNDPLRDWGDKKASAKGNGRRRDNGGRHGSDGDRRRFWEIIKGWFNEAL